MVAPRFLVGTTTLLVCVLATALISPMATAQTAEQEAELLLRMAELRARLLAAQNQPKVQPKVEPKTAPKPLPAAAGAMPEGAIARLGDSRLRHAGLPTCVVFSPDGKRVYSGGADGALRVWDVATGEAVNSIQRPLDAVSAVRFTHGGTKLAVCFSDARLRLLDPNTLKEEGVLPVGVSAEFAVSADGNLIAAITPTGFLTITESGSNLPKLELSAAQLFAFRPDGKTFVVAEEGKEGKVTLYMLAGGKPIATFEHGAPLNGLVFSEDGKRLATGSGHGGRVEVLKIWELGAKGFTLVAEIAGASKPRAWIGNDKIAAGVEANAGVYDISAKRWVGQAKGITGEWAVSPDGTKIAATGNVGLRVRLWDLATGKQLHAENDTFPDPALLTASADGKTVFVLAGESAYHWSVGLVNPAAKATATAAGTIPAKATVAVANGKRLAIATAGGVLVYDDFDATKPLAAKPSRIIDELAAGCRAVALSPDGTKVAYSGDLVRIAIADAATSKTIRVLSTQTVGIALEFTPDSKNLAVIGRDGFLRLWSAAPVAEGKADADIWKTRVQRGQKATVSVSPDGKLIAASSSAMLKVVNAADGSEVFTVGNLFEYGLFHHSAFSPDSRLIIAGTDGTAGSVLVWEVATRTLVSRYSTGFGSITRLGIFPDGTKALSAGAEETVTLWDLSDRHGKEAPKPAELLTAWASLDSLEGAKGVPAARTLMAGGAKSLPTITAGLEETFGAHKNLVKWAKDLASEEFADREAATKALREAGFRALPFVQATAANSESPEAKKRAAEIITYLIAKGFVVPPHGLAGDTLRLFRSVQVLEAIGGVEAKSLLTRIADVAGSPGDEAKAALKRMGK